MLARPIESLEQQCYATAGMQYSERAAAAATPAAAAAAARQAQQRAAAAPAQQACALPGLGASSALEGMLGTGCCDEGDAAHQHHQHHQNQHQHAPAGASGRAQEQQPLLSLPTGGAQYYGLVVQGQHRADVEGCYVLKLSRASTASDCSCLHYSVTRVCQGAPLQQQLLQSWLTAP
jgi:hypothetical protein